MKDVKIEVTWRDVAEGVKEGAASLRDGEDLVMAFGKGGTAIGASVGAVAGEASAGLLGKVVGMGVGSVVGGLAGVVAGGVAALGWIAGHAAADGVRAGASAVSGWIRDREMQFHINQPHPKVSRLRPRRSIRPWP